MSNLVPFGSYGPMEHPDYWAADPPEDGECPCDSPDYATGDCPIHDTQEATP